MFVFAISFSVKAFFFFFLSEQVRFYVMILYYSKQESYPKTASSSKKADYSGSCALLWLTVSRLDRTQICLDVTSSTGSFPNPIFYIVFWASNSSHKGTS